MSDQPTNAPPDPQAASEGDARQPVEATPAPEPYCWHPEEISEGLWCLRRDLDVWLGLDD